MSSRPFRIEPLEAALADAEGGRLSPAKAAPLKNMISAAEFAIKNLRIVLSGDAAVQYARLTDPISNKAALSARC